MTTVITVPSPTHEYKPPRNDEEDGTHLQGSGSPAATGLYSEEKMIMYREEDPAMKGISMDWVSALGPTQKKVVKAYGWKVSPFIFISEFGERLGAYGLQINLITYLLFEMNMPTAEGANIVTNFFGATCLTPLAGAILADVYFGKYMITAFGSIIYLVGLLILTIAAIDPVLRPDPCTTLEWFTGKCQQASSLHMGILYLSLVIQSIGSGGVRPCTAPLGAEQFDESSPEHTKQLRHFFNWYYTAIGLSILFSYTIVVWIETALGFGYGFGFCALIMGIGTIVFLSGTPWYRILPPQGSPITGLVRVLTASFRKRGLPLPQDSDDMYEAAADKETAPGLVQKEKILHTNNFRFLDKAAIIDEKDQAALEATAKYNPWRLCTAHQVEEMKILLRMAPVWACAVIMSTVIVQSGTFSVIQAQTMDRRISIGALKFEIPPASMASFTMISVVIFLPLYDLVLIPILSRFTGHPKGISYLQRIGAGLFLSILGMMSAALVEKKRRNYAIASNNVDLPIGSSLDFSAFWQVPQHVLLGIADSLMVVGQLEFFYDEAPVNIRTMSNAFLGAALGVGSFLSSAFVTITQEITTTSLYAGWLQDNTNRGHLDYFYWFLTTLSGMNFIIFLGISWWYVYKKSAENAENSKEGTKKHENQMLF